VTTQNSTRNAREFNGNELAIGCDVTKLNTPWQGVYHGSSTLVLAHPVAIPGGNELGSEHHTHDKSPGNRGGGLGPLTHLEQRRLSSSP